MSRHFTKVQGDGLSQNFPSRTTKVAPDMMQADTYVLLCDWRGQIVWKSGTGDRAQIGEEIWKHAAHCSKEDLQSAVASVVTLREHRVVELQSDQNERFRFWMWPLNDPDIALCILARQIPNEMALLTERERACLSCLSQGKSTRVIAEELGIGLTTVHTHLRHSREKLGLASGDALIGFAARYFYSPLPVDASHSPASRKRSG
jgi:DNA-binding CsgD family transcriptional regulator